MNPWAGPVDLLLGLVATTAGVVAARKTRKAREQAALARTIIEGVEQAGDPGTKEAVAKHARRKGIADKVDLAVQKVTRNL